MKFVTNYSTDKEFMKKITEFIYSMTSWTSKAQKNSIFFNNGRILCYISCNTEACFPLELAQ